MNDIPKSKSNIYPMGGIVVLITVVFLLTYNNKEVVAPVENKPSIVEEVIVETDPVKTNNVKTLVPSNVTDTTVSRSPINPESKQVTPSGLPTMTYTSKGFNPMVLEIKRGQSVRFVNNSGVSMRLISNTDGGQIPYPAFSQSKTVGLGGVYEFTFTVPGAWGFKNQFDTVHFGVVIVQ